MEPPKVALSQLWHWTGRQRVAFYQQNGRRIWDSNLWLFWWQAWLTDFDQLLTFPELNQSVPSEVKNEAAQETIVTNTKSSPVIEGTRWDGSFTFRFATPVFVIGLRRLLIFWCRFLWTCFGVLDSRTADSCSFLVADGVGSISGNSRSWLDRS